ncbi:inhibin beta E chain [Trichonephila clavipes]|nr:inhibin beta E chain [Trichonephila clavipes]
MKVVSQLVLFFLFTVASVIAESSISSDEEMGISFRKRCDIQRREPTSIPSTTEPTSIPSTTEPTSIPSTTEPTSIPSTTEPTSIPSTTEPTSIPSTTEPTPRDRNLEKAIIEDIKVHVLMTMNLTEPRVINRTLPFLQSFDANSSSWDNSARNFSDDYSGYKNWKIHFARSEIVPNSCHHQNGEPCVRFQITVPRQVSNSSKYVAEMWLYKKENVTEYTITQIITDPLQATTQETFHVSHQTEREFWTRLDVAHLIEKLPTNVLIFEVHYSSESPFLTTESKKPLLMTFTYRD